MKMRNVDEVIINGKSLKDILLSHKKWLNEDEDGIRANLRGANLSGTDLRGANLRHASLRYADLSGADLQDADLQDADLQDADLQGADLSKSNLRHADLSGVDLSYADLSDADLRGANLRYADLSGVDLSYVNLSGADLIYADLSQHILTQKQKLETISFTNNTTFSQSQCPEEKVQMSKNYKELSKEKLIEAIQEYSNYVTEYSEANDISPVCFSEFFQNDYQAFPHNGDIVSIYINLCDDDDFVNWFEGKKYEDATQFKVVETDYYGTFNIWVEDCPYAINPEIVKIRKKYSH